MSSYQRRHVHPSISQRVIFSETVKWGLMKFGIEGVLCKLLGELHFGFCPSNKLRTLHGSYSELFQLT